MKKSYCIVILMSLILICTVVMLYQKEKQFFLEDSAYGKNQITEIELDTLNQLIKEKKSFAIFIYQPACTTSSEFEKVIKEFQQDTNINLYKISFSNIKDSPIGKVITYYPSFILYHNGNMIDYLEADNEEDTKYYTSKTDFTKWFTKYVKLKQPTLSPSHHPVTKTSEAYPTLEDVELNHVVKEDNKVNIYFFWGDGCPHCKEEFQFFENIKEEYGEYYNLYTFETWNSEENLNLLYTFAKHMDNEVTGVPYTIIGTKTFTGFGEEYQEDFKKAIETERLNQFDVYFDKIKG